MSKASSPEHRQVVRISPEALTAAKKHADSRDADLGETIDGLIITGVSRRAALTKYAKKQAPKQKKASVKRAIARKKKGPQPRRGKKKRALAEKLGPVKKKKRGVKAARPLAEGVEAGPALDAVGESEQPQSQRSESASS